MKLFFALVLFISVGGIAIAAEAPAAKPASAASAKTIKLFNGQNLDGWYSYLEKPGRDNDPNGNFQVVDGVIHILGQDFGYISTKASYDNYRLKVEFKWGTRQFAPRATGKRDSGILYHFADGEMDKVWPKSIECQVQETDCGDIWCVGGTDVTSPNHSAQEWNQKRVYRTENHELPNSEWNTIEVIARGDTLEHYVNGHLVNIATKLSVSRGKIVLQAEGAEIFYRLVELTPLD